MAFGDIKGTKTGSATSITASFAISTGTSFAVVVGDLIVSLLAEQSALTVTACADDLGNTYTPIGAGADAGTVTGRGFYTRVTNAGTLTTVTFTATASANNCVGLAVGFEGPFAVSPLDATPTTIINDNTTPYTCPATGTLAQAVELIVCAIVHNSNPTLTATAPNTKAVELNTATVLKAALGHQTVSSTASVTPAWTSSGTPTTSGYATASFMRETTPGAGSAPGTGTASAVGEAVTGTLDAWNTYDKSANVTLSNSDKTAILSSSVTAGVRSTQRQTSGADGKYYVEFVINASNPFGVRVGFSSTAQSVTVTTNAISVDASDGTVYFGASIITDGWEGTAVDGDVICLAWHSIGGSADGVWARLNNGDWNNDPSNDPATDVGGGVAATPDADYALWMRAANSGRGATLRTEAAEFTYAGPSGFTSWMGEALGSVGDADGVGAAAATSEATKETVGTAAGAATATGGGSQLATVAGTGNATSAATAVGVDGASTVTVDGDGAAAGVSAAAAVGAEVVILRPDGDTALDGWTDQADGTTDIYQSIDEVTLNDSDYVQSPSFASADADLVVRLFDGATEIAEWTHSDIADTFVTAEQTLTTPQFEAITNFSDLFVELDDNQGNVYRFPVSNPASGVSEPVTLRYRYKKLAA